MKHTSIFSLATAFFAGTMLTFAPTASAEEPEPIAAEPLTERHAFPDGRLFGPCRRKRSG
ncbi:hypothetical protein [Nitratireductor sp. GCM10026969]|uniref:hypothetical protein n=1 Tax=Nitratireductor sp. GCM10026969 TaxID=3252645 RepID=UPI00360D530F